MILFKNVIKRYLCLLLMMGLIVAGCSNDSSHGYAGGGITSLFEKHKKVQLWKNGPYWAETNIGAENPWDFGYYFWWGDTIGYKRVNDAWVASDGSSSDFSFDSEYVPTYRKNESTLLQEGWVKGINFNAYTFLLPEHDAAHVHWGGEWRMPTEREMADLVNKCDWEWTEIKGVGGYVVRGKGAYATARIFLPAAGHGDGKSHRSGGWAGDYWSSVPLGVGDSFAVALFFYSDRHNTNEYSMRYTGHPIRPVQGFSNVKESGKNEKEDCAAFAQVHGVVADFVRETVTEAEDADVIFTDGSLDEELRDEIKRRNLTLQPCSVMASPKSAEVNFLEKMKNGAVAQLGYDQLRRSGKLESELQFSGVLFRQSGMSDSVRRRGIESAERLATRILDIQKKEVVDSINDEEMRRKFLSVQWRIARMAQARAEQECILGLSEQSERSLEIADKLDECNSALRQIRQRMASAQEKTQSGLSAKDRLRMALSRANFEEARKSAREILAETPDEPDANFAVAMWHYQHKRWSDAERHFLRCKIKRPREVATLNNLAIVYMNLGRLDEARAYVRQALSLRPDSADVKDTLSQVEKVIEKRRQ